MRFAVIDAETDPFAYGADIAPFIWGFYDGEIYRQFYDTQKFVEFLREEDCLVYAHNGGKFDYHFLLPWIEPGQEILVINGRLAKLKLGKAELRDSYNVLPVPLAAFKKDDFDYRILAKHLRSIPANKEKIEKYLKSDCLNLYEIVAAFLGKYGPLISQASASMHLYKEQTGNKPPKSSAQYFETLRPFYYGGRVQCFTRGVGKERFKVFDINSAYPWAMLQRHPFGTKMQRTRAVKVESAYETPQSFYRLECASPKGAFPWREKVGGKLIFPADNEVREYMVTGWELRAALKAGALRKVKALEKFTFNDTKDFSDYMLPIFAARRAAQERGDETESLLLKLAANSLYGKFGADPSKYSRSVLFPVESLGALKGWRDSDGNLRGAEFEGREYFNPTGHALGNCLLGERPLDEKERRYYNVATAASITGAVRAYLWESMRACERVLYCDTDSIVCVNGDALPQGKELGLWKPEGDFTKWYIAGRKLYALETTDSATVETLTKKGGVVSPCGTIAYKIASKGARLTPEEIKTVASGGTVEYCRDAPTFTLGHGMRYTKRTIRQVD